ncbi:MAG: hypothetical protein MUO43_15230, partial [Desulfobacterales bacterium]|nr:hypothetical protein [Desulfobacterales bacterium]
RSEDYVDIANYVLDQFNTNEKNVLDRMIEKARDAVVATICKGTKKAMNIFNDKRLITTQVQSPKVHGSRLESDED